MYLKQCEGARIEVDGRMLYQALIDRQVLVTTPLTSL